jgi:hypothetical protein
MRAHIVTVTLRFSPSFGSSPVNTRYGFLLREADWPTGLSTRESSVKAAGLHAGGLFLR